MFEQPTAFAISANPDYFTTMNRRWSQAAEQLREVLNEFNSSHFGE